MTLLSSSEEENHGQVRVTLEFYSTNNLKYSMSMQKKKKKAKKMQYICKAIINPKSSNCYDAFSSPIQLVIS